MMNKLRMLKPTSLIVAAFLALASIMMILPFYWLLVTSFKPGTTVIKMPPDLSLAKLTWENYSVLFADSIIWLWTFNSFFVAAIVVIGNVIFCTMAGYVFAKKEFPGKRIIFWLVISIMMISTQVIMVPLFMFVRDMGLLNTYWGMILPALASPFAVFMTKQFVQTIPNELISAAKMDGCSELGIYWKVIVPLSKPVIALIAIFTFIGQWNDFLWPLLITESRDMRTLQVGLASLQLMRLNYGTILAGSVWTMVPVVILFLSFQSLFVKGITVGAVKG